METIKLTVLSVLFVYCYRTQGQNIQGQLRYRRQGGLLSGFTSFSGDFSVPSISSGLETIAQGVRGILSTTKDTVEKLAQPASFGFSAQIGQTYEQPEYGSDNSNFNREQIGQSADYRDTRPNSGRPGPNNAQFDHFNANGNTQPEYNPDNITPNNANSRPATNSYSNYEVPNHNRGDRFNGDQANIDNTRNNKQQEQDGVVTYLDNNFPVILLKENEIRK